MSSSTSYSFVPVAMERAIDQLSRPSLSYWQDAWIRLKANRRAFYSLHFVVVLMAFAFLGPYFWTTDWADQDLDQPSQPPWADRAVLVTEPYEPWAGVPAESAGLGKATERIQVIGMPSTSHVRLTWRPVSGASGYRVYRNILDPADGPAGLPIGTNLGENNVSFEDRLDVQGRKYWYSIIAFDEVGHEYEARNTVEVDVVRTTTVENARAQGWIDESKDLVPGDMLMLPWHPLGTDYLGRDMLSRLMKGAQISLFIGIVAPFLFVITGVIYGAISGFMGGRVDALLMRFADFVIALPFLLFMILFKLVFNIGPGESGIIPLLVALVLLSWPGAARLVRGQILQIREEAFVSASRLLGTKTTRLVLRHMIPNTMGVVLVTFTFAVPSAIFTEAFLSFIGMGVEPPTPSWGTMCNEGIKTMETAPHELVFPAIFISLTVLAFNMLGDGLRDALDARMRATE